MKLWVYIVRRLLLMIPVLIGVVTITFIIISAVPISERLTACIPPSRRQPQPGTPAYNNELKICGLDVPIYQQYGNYLLNSFTFKWGFIQNSSADGMWQHAPQVKPCLQLPVSQAEGGCEVATLIGAWLPYTMELAVLSLAIILLMAIPMGNLSAVNRNRAFDQASRVFSFSGFAVPGYLLGALLILALFFILTLVNPSGGCDGSPYNQIIGSWHASLNNADQACYTQVTTVNGQTVSTVLWNAKPPYANAIYATHPTGFPTVDGIIYALQNTPPPGMPGGRYYYWDLVADHVLRLIIPALTIAYGTVALLLRYVRNSMLEVMNLDFVRTARSKGVPERLVVKHHAGRNSLNVTVTVLGLTFAAFLSGFAIIESLFGLFGVGMLFAYSVFPSPDISTIFASTVLFTVIIVVANVIVDVIYGVLDPRVRLG